ncbi:MAG: hypothetical protein RIT81_46760 [Deltaproteobacteria bacterium]
MLRRIPLGLLLICSVAHAEERTVTGHGRAEGGRDPQQIARLQAEEEATMLSSTIPFRIDLEGEGQPFTTKVGPCHAKDVRAKPTGKNAWTVEVDAVVPAAVAERRAKLGEPRVGEHAIIHKLRGSARASALKAIVLAANPCGSDVSVVSGTLDVVEMSEAKKLDGKSWLRVAAHITFDTCGDAREL